MKFKIEFNAPVSAKYVKIVPVTWKHSISLRCGVMISSNSKIAYGAEKLLLASLEDKFYQTSPKTVLAIDLALSILKINETLKIVEGGNNCLVLDPWRFDTGKLRKDALTCRAL
jgi:hypothetical protein